jgi:CubicO group peptidase (beta-lactamase class C family)
MAAFCQMILNNSTRRAPTSSSSNLNGEVAPDDDSYSLDFAMNATSFMGLMASGQTIGHRGFTGTSINIGRATNTAFIHLANRGHPSSHWSTNNPDSRAPGYWSTQSLGRTVTFPAL